MQRILQTLILIGLLTTAFNIAYAQPNRNAIQVLALISYEAPQQQRLIEGFQKFFAEKKISLDLNVQNIKNLTDTKQKPTLVLALGSAATQYAMGNFKQTPICASLLVDDSLLKNNRNVTGVSLSFPLTTHLEWLNRFIPKGRAVGVIYHPEKNAVELDKLQHDAAGLGITIIPQAVRQPTDLDEALKRLPSQAAALWSFDDASIFTPQNAESLLLFSFRNRIPVVGLSSQWVKAGALYALDRDYYDMGQQCAEQALRIVQGTPVQQIPAERPRKVLYSINQRTAEHMKLDLPSTLIEGAYELYP